MAIFEKKIERKVTLDDTESLSCAIETAQKVDGHTAYVLKVQRGPFKENCWRLLRRYNDFVALDKSLQISGICPRLPGKKLIGNMHPDFIAQRRVALQEYINAVLMNAILASSLNAKRFFDPDSYSIPFHDLALQHASLCLRTEGLYALGPSLGPVGWRLRKHYFKVSPKLSNSKQSPSQSHSKHHLVKSGSQGNKSCPPVELPQEFVLTWTEYGPDKYIDEKEIHIILKNLSDVQHPFIHPIEYVASNDSGALVIRKFYKQGSLKDLLCGVPPLNAFLGKYGNPKGRTPLPMQDVALYGRQILEATRFLHSKGLAHGHLHAGNVVIVDGMAKLLDIENFILGIPAFYRPFYVQHAKIHSFDSIDVYSFGHLMYEMCMGYPLQESVVRQITDCPESLKSLLESILTRDALKIGLPTLDQIASHRFFTEFASSYGEVFNNATHTSKPHLKLSIGGKEKIKVAADKADTRLRDEQKSIKNQKRLVRVQEMMSSEEEKKKIKHKARQEQKQLRLKQQSSLQLQNGPPQTSPTPGIVRSDSVNSISTAVLESVSTPPPTTKGPPVPPPFQMPSMDTFDLRSPPSLPPTPTCLVTDDPSCDDSYGNPNRSALLSSICNFKKANLRRVVSDD